MYQGRDFAVVKVAKSVAQRKAKHEATSMLKFVDVWSIRCAIQRSSEFRRTFNFTGLPACLLKRLRVICVGCLRHDIASHGTAGETRKERCRASDVGFAGTRQGPPRRARQGRRNMAGESAYISVLWQ